MPHTELELVKKEKKYFTKIEIRRRLAKVGVGKKMFWRYNYSSYISWSYDFLLICVNSKERSNQWNVKEKLKKKVGKNKEESKKK